MTLPQGKAGRIRAELGGNRFERFFAAVRRRLEDKGTSAARTVALTGLTVEERQAVADLLGSKLVPEESARLDLAKLEEALCESALAATVVEVVEALGGGPLANRKSLRDQAQAAREALWQRARRTVQGRAELATWLEDLRSSGLVLRLARAEGREEGELLKAALSTTARLPSQGVLLSVLASEVAGDAHALDHGCALGTLVLKAAGCISGWVSVPPGAAGRRLLWATVGVACDPLSNDVLTLGLRPRGGGRLERHLRESSADGEPRRVTLRELMRVQRLETEGTVFVCENPSVVAAAADRLAGQCAALVCSDGVPTTAALELLARIRKGGGSVRVHADFDWAGIRIGNLLRERVGAEPWCFGVAEYSAAAEQATRQLPPAGAGLSASWDAGLVPAMRTIGRAVYEEQVLEALLQELRDGPR